MTDRAEKEQRLAAVIADIGPMIVAFSGGVDSSLLALAAYRELGSDMVAITADSASLADGELQQCKELAANHSIPWESVATFEMTNDRYVANDGDRCYWCKSALMDQLHPMGEQRNATVTLGVNLDDLGDHRPGQEAAAARGARFPLVEAELTKQDIRDLAQAWGLEVWDRPGHAMPIEQAAVRNAGLGAAALQDRSFRGSDPSARIQRCPSPPLRRHRADRAPE